MGKRIGVILDDWFYTEAIEKRPEGVSESARVRELIMKGWKTSNQKKRGE